MITIEDAVRCLRDNKHVYFICKGEMDCAFKVRKIEGITSFGSEIKINLQYGGGGGVRLEEVFLRLGDALEGLMSYISDIEAGK